MLLRIIAAIVVLIIVLLAGSWLGLQVKAASYPAGVPGAEPEQIPLPENLPAPVRRFAQALFGDTLPQVESAQVIGVARLAPTGLPMPARFRFYYETASSSYYHDIEVTWFTLPFLNIHERNLAGHTTLDLALLGHVDDQPKTNRAAIQGYWAEMLAWVPAVALTDERVRWEAVDATTARLLLPELDDSEALMVRFDADTGLLAAVETMRYQSESNPDRLRWSNQILEWNDLNGQRVPVRSQTQWEDHTPWAFWDVEQVLLNADVAARMNQFGRN